VAVRQLTVKDGSRVTSTDEEAAQVLCDYFQQVFTREENERDFTSLTTTMMSSFLSSLNQRQY